MPASRDGPGGRRVVAGDHDEPDPRLATRCTAAGTEGRSGSLMLMSQGPPGSRGPPSARREASRNHEDAEAPVGQAASPIQERLPARFIQGRVTVATAQAGAAETNLFRRPFDADAVREGRGVERPARVEGGLAPALVRQCLEQARCWRGLDDRDVGPVRDTPPRRRGGGWPVPP